MTTSNTEASDLFGTFTLRPDSEKITRALVSGSTWCGRLQVYPHIDGSEIFMELGPALLSIQRDQVEALIIALREVGDECDDR